MKGSKPDVILLAELCHDRREMCGEIISDQHFDVLPWELPNVGEEDLSKPGVEFFHIKPPGFVCRVSGSWGTSLAPAREKTAVCTLVDRHWRQHLPVSTAQYSISIICVRLRYGTRVMTKFITRTKLISVTKFYTLGTNFSL